MNVIGAQAHMPRPGRDNQEDGFTLLELLLGLAILAVILSFIYVALTQGYESFYFARESSDIFTKGRVGLQLMAQEVEQTYFVPKSASTFFKGGERLSFVTFSSGSLPEVVEYYLAPGASGPGKTLVRQSLLAHLAAAGGQPTQEELADGILSLSFRYFDGSAWSSTWDASQCDCLPRLMEITLTLLTADNREITLSASARIPVAE